MKIVKKLISIDTPAGVSVADITSSVRAFVQEAALLDGQVLVFSKHTTTGLAINEYEKRLVQDIISHLEKVAPIDRRYLHDDVELRNCPPDERVNGHAHIKSLTFSPSVTIPLTDGEAALGKWQSVLLLDFDGGRKREIVLHGIGD